MTVGDTQTSGHDAAPGRDVSGELLLIDVAPDPAPPNGGDSASPERGTSGGEVPSLRLGQRLPGVDGQVVSPGPTPGTWWVVPDGGPIAGRVVTAYGQVLDTVTAKEQALRAWRARTILTSGLDVRAADDRSSPVAHLRGCVLAHGEELQAPAPASVAYTVLAGARVRVQRGLRHPQTLWCPGCLGERDTPPASMGRDW